MNAAAHDARSAIEESEARAELADRDGPECPWVDAGECGTARERADAAGAHNMDAPCPVHGKTFDPEPRGGAKSIRVEGVEIEVSPENDPTYQRRRAAEIRRMRGER